MNKKTFDPNQPITKVLEVCTRAPEATADQLAKIKPYLLREFSPEDLYIRQMMLANDQHDRSFERFDMGHLARFAETIIGKSVLEGHDYGTVPVGRFFDAEVTRADTGWNWVAPWFYMPKSAGNELVRDSIDSGVYSYVSIGCRVDWKGLVCDLCGRSYYGWDEDETGPRCPHLKGQTYDGQICTCTFDSTRSNMAKVEAVEGSIVYLGCQYDAAIAKSAEQAESSRVFKIDPIKQGDNKPPQGEQKPEGHRMTLEELKTQHPELAKEIADIETAKTAAETEVAALKPKAEVGTKLLEDLKNEIKRLAGCLGLGDATAEAVTTTDDVEKLLAVKADYAKQWADKLAANGKGDATAGTGEGDEPAQRVNPRDHDVF